MSSLLEVKNLHISISSPAKTTHIVRGISYFLKKGESLGIIGESGCGKSLGIRAILNLLPFSSLMKGEIIYQGREIKKFSENEIELIRSHEVAYCSQDAMNAFNPSRKMGDQIIEAYLKKHPQASLAKAKQTTQEIVAQLQFTSIATLLEAYPHTLSGGMRQRLLIAMALIRTPQLLIADEPTTGLDENLKMHVLNLIKSQQENRRMSLILVSHDLATIAQLCDKVIVMYAGKIVEAAPTAQLFTSPQHPYTKALINSQLHLNLDKMQPLYAIKGQPPNLDRLLKHCAFCERCEVAMNICAISEPDLYSVSSSHHSACFKHDKRNMQ